MTTSLRPAEDSDAEAIAVVWHASWADGHAGHVPDGLHRFRQLDEFRRRVPQRIANTTVAVADDHVVGFVTVHDDEIEQIFVDRSARGSGAAVALLRHGEQTIAGDHATAWLAVVAGNARARRFYEREGWYDAGPLEYVAETADGDFVVPTQRYEKRLGD